MTTPASPSLRLGAVGWDHDGWQGTFYPDDLPREWRLDYYANEFPAVLVPARQWAGLTHEVVEQWLEDLPGRFRFHLELPARQPLAETAWSLVDLLRPRVAGVLFAGPCDVLLAQRVAERLPDTILAQAPVVGAQDPLAASPIAPCWRPDVGRGATVALGVVPPAHRELPQLRALLESFMGAFRAHTEASLFFAGAPPDADELRNALTVAGLLGAL